MTFKGPFQLKPFYDSMVPPLPSEQQRLLCGLWAAHKISLRRFLKLARRSLLLLEPLSHLSWLLQSHPCKTRYVNKRRLSGLLIATQQPPVTGDICCGDGF